MVQIESIISIKPEVENDELEAKRAIAEWEKRKSQEYEENE